MAEATTPPNLLALEEVVRRYGLLVKWAFVAAVAGAIWITAMTLRVASLERQMDTVVDTLKPVERALDRIQDRLGIPQPEKPK